MKSVLQDNFNMTLEKPIPCADISVVICPMMNGEFVLSSTDVFRVYLFPLILHIEAAANNKAEEKGEPKHITKTKILGEGLLNNS